MPIFDINFKVGEKVVLSDVVNEIVDIFDKINILKKKDTAIYSVNDAEECVICLNNKGNGKVMFECIMYHPICDSCFREYYNTYKSVVVCPLCRTSLKSEYKCYQDMSIIELVNIDINHIDKRLINTVNINLPKNIKQTTICTNNSHVKLYTKNGNQYRYKSLFVGINGFLYRYNKEYDAYHIECQDNKLLRWK